MIKLSHPSDPGQITLIDLEPKSVAKLPQWEKLDATIVQAYIGVQDKVCIDACQPV
jgi:inositol-pentakisphosphate 2-kinase